jgi:hypothetical protein
VRQRARDLANTSEFALAQRQRKKEGGSLVRGTEESDRSASGAPAEIEVRAEQCFLAATAQNIKRLVRFLSQGPRHSSTRKDEKKTFRTHLFNPHGMFRQLSNRSNVLTLRMDRYPLSELTGASFCVPCMLAGQFEHLGGGLLNLASQTLIGFGTFLALKWI